jgi:hypothetical protein
MRTNRLLLLLTTVGLLLPVSATAQGLGDASKKEKERRERAAPVPSKSYTQDDLKALPPVANEDSHSAEAGASTGSAPAAQETTRQPADNHADKRAQDEKMWRSRVAASRERIDVARQKYETLAAGGGDPRWELRGLRDLVDPQVIAAAKAEVDAAQKALDDLQEEARRANVPPGWLR